jgi:8-hydroxy-5-deazaflavin:NADPH oxidoreductase
MSYAIIGSGHIGSAIAGHFARVGIAALIANTRGPESLADLIATMGEVPTFPGNTAGSPVEA